MSFFWERRRPTFTSHHSTDCHETLVTTSHKTSDSTPLF